MKKIFCLLSALFLAVLCAASGAADGVKLPGMLADFTAGASTVTNYASKAYEHFWFDYDGDGEEEMIYLAGLESKDGTWPLSATIFAGPDSHSLGWSPNKKIPDGEDIRVVCFIDVNPADGKYDLVVSAAGQDGSEYTMILQGPDKHNEDDKFGRQWKDGSDQSIFSGLFRGITEDGVLLIGETKYVWDEKYWLKEVGALEPGEDLFPGWETPEPADTPPAQPEPEPASGPEETAVPDDSSGGSVQPGLLSGPGSSPFGSVLTEVKYVGTAFTSRGVELDPAVLPEYSVIFHGDGSASFIMAGNELPSLTWTLDGQDAVIEYAKQELRFVPDSGSLVVDIFGTIQARMTPVELQPVH